MSPGLLQISTQQQVGDEVVGWAMKLSTAGVFPGKLLEQGILELKECL